MLWKPVGPGLRSHFVVLLLPPSFIQDSPLPRTVPTIFRSCARLHLAPGTAPQTEQTEKQVPYFRVHLALNPPQSGRLRMRVPHRRKRAWCPLLPTRRRRPKVRCLRDSRQAARPPPGSGVSWSGGLWVLRHPGEKPVRQVSLEGKGVRLAGSHCQVPFLSGDGFYPATPRGPLSLSLLFGVPYTRFRAPS